MAIHRWTSFRILFRVVRAQLGPGWGKLAPRHMHGLTLRWR